MNQYAHICIINDFFVRGANELRDEHFDDLTIHYSKLNLRRDQVSTFLAKHENMVRLRHIRKQ